MKREHCKGTIRVQIWRMDWPPTR